MSAAPNQRQPWLMKWIVVAIILVIVLYTILTIRYRKPGPAFQSYEDMKNCVNVSRLLSAGYQRVPIRAQRPADGTRTTGGADVTSVAGGLPADLRVTLVETPLLPMDILSVTAAAATKTLLPYAVQCTCTLPDDKKQLAGADLYVREETIVITPTFEHVAGGLVTRSREAAVLFTVPSGTLKPGHYNVTLVGKRFFCSWPLDVE